MSHRIDYRGKFKLKKSITLTYLNQLYLKLKFKVELINYDLRYNMKLIKDYGMEILKI